MSEAIHTISSEPDSLGAYTQKFWRHKILITTFAFRDLKVKYAQTFFGILWVAFQPLPSVIIFTFFFGTLIKVNTGILPYPIFALIGMIGWNYFTNLALGAGNSLIESQHILKKISFPKIILPVSKIFSSGVDFLIAFAVIIAAMIIYSVYPNKTIIFLPFFILLNILTGLSVGLWMSALTFRYRDLQHIAPSVINFMIWLTPVFYSATILPQKLSYLMYANPMALVIEGYRFSLTGQGFPSRQYVISVIPILLLFVSGFLYFRKIEDEIVDYI